MPKTQDGPLLDALLDSWDRNNTILVNLLRALPDGGWTPERQTAVQPSRNCSCTSTMCDSCSSLKADGRPFDDEEIGPVTWDVWMDKGKWS